MIGGRDWRRGQIIKKLKCTPSLKLHISVSVIIDTFIFIWEHIMGTWKIDFFLGCKKNLFWKNTIRKWRLTNRATVTMIQGALWYMTPYDTGRLMIQYPLWHRTPYDTQRPTIQGALWYRTPYIIGRPVSWSALWYRAPFDTQRPMIHSVLWYTASYDTQRPMIHSALWYTAPYDTGRSMIQGVLYGVCVWVEWRCAGKTRLWTSPVSARRPNEDKVCDLSVGDCIR